MTITNLTTRLKRRVVRSVAIVAFGMIFSGATVAGVEAKTASLPKDGAEAKTVNETSQHVESTSIKEGAKSGDRLVLTLNGVEFAFRWVEPGEFWMGSPTNEEGRDADERRRRVALSQGFYVGETELTQKQWFAIQAESTNAEDRRLAELYEDDDAPDMPAHSLSWFAAQNFVDALNAGGFLDDVNSCDDDGSEDDGGEVDEEKNGENEGWIFRLPTEAEWERAARAETSTRFFFGDNPQELTTYGNVADSSLHKANGAFPGLASDDGFPYIAPVGRFKPNAWGIADVVGNCREWTSDWFGWFGVDDNSDEKTIYVDPTGPDYGDPRDPKNVRRQKVARGGFWLCMPDELRSADRFATVPGDKAENLSMRLVLAPQSNETKPIVKPAITKGTRNGERLVLNLRGVEFAFRWVNGGSYRIGSPSDEEGRGVNENRRDVVISEGFWICETETTQRQYLEFAQRDGYFAMDEPAHSTSYIAAQDYLDALNAWGFLANGVGSGSEVEQKYEFRLPTSAEWEVAARAGTSTPFFFGANPERLARYGNCADKTFAAKHPECGHAISSDDGYEWVAPVRSFKPNDWALYDTAGNCAEWVSDWYVGRPNLEPTVDPTGPDFGDARLEKNAKRLKEVRGGHAVSRAAECRSALRGGTHPGDSAYNLSFRIVLAPVKKARKAPTLPTVKRGEYAGERTTLRVNDVEFAFRWCPPGTYVMGSQADETGRRAAGETRRTIRITRGFWLQETETTVEQFVALAKPDDWKTFCYNGGDGCLAWDWLNRPVTQLTWFETNELVKDLNEAAAFANTGDWTWGIPTEAMWEYACRAGSETPWHNESLDAVAWFGQNTGKEGGEAKRPHAVAQKKPNAWGFHDMHGNVHEWTLDWHDDVSRRLGRVDVHPGADFDFEDDRKIFKICQRYKVLRGGAFGSSMAQCRSAAYEICAPDWEHFDLGVRLALVPKFGKRPETGAYDVDLKKRFLQTAPNRRWQRNGVKKPGDLAALEIVNKNLKKDGSAILAMRWCPPGTFTMGSSPDEDGRGNDEIQRQVTLTQGFWMMNFEVSELLWRVVTGEADETKKLEHWKPKRRATYYDALRFVETLNANDCAPKGWVFALPTEAQWEYACRAGTTTKYYWGEKNATAIRVQIKLEKELRDSKISVEDLAKQIEPVGSGARWNDWGICDMIGNVTEWCADSYGVYSDESVVDPLETFRSDLVVHRGGSCLQMGDSKDEKRSATRFWANPYTRSDYIGFRVILIKDDEE